MNQDYKQLTNTVRGLTNEETLDNGDIILSYSDYSTHFLINDEKIAKTLMLENINVNVTGWNEIMENASLKSANNQYLYYSTRKYNIVIDTNKKSATFTIKD